MSLKAKKIINNQRYSSCPVCNLNNITKIGVINMNYFPPMRYSSIEIELSHDPELWLCKNCNSGFTQNFISEKDSIELYSEGSTEKRWGSTTFKKMRSEDTVAILNKYLLKGKRVLDIGCSNGAFLDYAKSRGCITAGVEYSKESSLILTKNGHSFFRDIALVEEKYDIITLFDLIEHSYDIKALLKRCELLLKPNGTLIIITGDINSREAIINKNNWWYVSLPEHIIFPSLSSYSKFGFKTEFYKKLNPWAYEKLTFSGLLRQIICKISINYAKWPFKVQNHYLVVLKTEKNN